MPGPEEPEQAPLLLDYMPGLEYPEYLALSDEEVPVKDQPYVVTDSPITLSPCYVADSDPEEDSKDGPVDYPTDGGDGDDDDSSDDNDEEEEASDEEEDDHLALADSVVTPVVDHVPSSEETNPFTPLLLPACRTTARISIQPEAPIPFPLEEEVERLLALPPPPPSPLISLSPPSTEERLARCLAVPALPSSPLPIIPHLYGSPNHVRAPPGFRAAIGRLRASSPSTHHPLHPSPPLPPPPSSLHLPPHVPTSLPLASSLLPPLPGLLFIPPPVNRREDTLKVELPPCKRLCLTTLTSRYEARESLTDASRLARGHGIDYRFIGTLDEKPDVKEPRALPLLPLPSAPLPPLPDSLFIPPVDRREDIPEAELPPRKRICLTTPASRYEVGESSTAIPRPTGGRRVDYGFIGTLDAEARRQRAEAVGYGIRDTWVYPRETTEEIAPVTLEGVNTRVTELASVHEQDTQEIYAVIEDTQDRQTQMYQTVETLVDDGRYHYETARLLDQEALVSREAWAHSIGFSSAGHLATALGEIRALQAREQARADAPEGTGSSS
ncbi:hypothetical protein Tco_0924322 [Tanacetum coccineum]|uniref:Uncharacterized protein n=1 Tax=Tanacetum coccineum TaxID=301880 RepID=A0ABQ5D5P5_9ASTR